jgi:hypothetical protein
MKYELKSIKRVVKKGDRIINFFGNNFTCYEGFLQKNLFLISSCMAQLNRNYFVVNY